MNRIYTVEEMKIIDYILDKDENDKWLTKEELDFVKDFDFSDKDLPNTAKIVWRCRKNPMVLRLFMKDVELEEKDRLINKRGGNFMENNKLVIFKNDDFGEIRSITIDNEPYFVGKDIAEVLGYTNSRKAIQDHVDIEDKMDGVTICDSIGRNQSAVVINESGLYSLIMSSKMPTAKQFKRWVTNEVLPSIRKNGGYIANQENISDDEYIARALVLAERKINEKEQILLQREAEIREMKPKVNYYDQILQNKSTVTISSIAQDYGMSGMTMNQLLHELGIQYKESQQWYLYGPYKGQGYVKGKTHKYEHSDGTPGYSINTEWTQKGRKFIYDKLKEHGIVPLIEREVDNV